MKNSIIKELKKVDKKTRNRIVEHHPLFSNHTDLYTKWIPELAVVALEAAGVKTKNNLRDKLKLIAAGETVLNLALYPLKHIARRGRPNGIGHGNSFPSGHTATSFLGAEILHQELKDHHPVASYSGYALAFTTGILRLYNNKHWLSDVAAGAVLGVAAAKLTCRYFNKSKENNKVQPALS